MIQRIQILTKGVYENLNDLIVALNQSDADKTTSIMILDNVIRDLIQHDIPLSNRGSADNLLQQYTQKIQTGDLRYASGFFGHWAKNIEDDKDEIY